MSSMGRRIWIVGLAFAFWFYLAVSVGIATALIARQHLGAWGWILFVANSYIAWLTYTLLRQRIAADRRRPIPTLP